VIVGGKPDGRGVVSACSYETRAFGVRSGMPLRTASRLCPEATFLPGRFQIYSAFGARVRDVLIDAAPLVERASIDEYYLDITGCDQLFGDLRQWCEDLAHRVEDATGLPITLGLATNKLVAKTATGVFKRSRRPGERVIEVPPGTEAVFFARLPARAIAGIGARTAEKLASHGLTTLGEIQQCEVAHLRALFGDQGESIHRRAHGIDNRPVQPKRRPKSIGHERTFSDDKIDAKEILRMLRHLAERTASDLRRKGRTATRVHLKWRYDDFETLSRSVTIPATDEAIVLFQATLPNAQKFLRTGRAVRLVGIRAEGLAENHYPSGLFDASPEKRRHLLEAVDRLRDRYGDDIIGPGSLR
jgi:DNA polymerase IV